MHESLRNRLLSAKFELGSLLGHHTWLFLLWCKLVRPDFGNRLISYKTDIVIEGFPRSVNTFAVAAFSIAQDRPVHIARHTHRVAHVAIAVQRMIPTLVVIRHPADAVLSLVIRRPYISLRQGLRSYIRYYEGIKPLRHGFLLAKFEDVITDFGEVTRKVNRRFDTAFAVFDHTDVNVNKCFQRIEEMHRISTGRGNIIERAVARPSTEREELKTLLKLELEKKELQSLLQQAEKLYMDFRILTSIADRSHDP